MALDETIETLSPRAFERRERPVERPLMMSGLMSGKRGLVMGVANDHSIAWGIAKALASEGAELAFTYQGDALGKRVTPLAESLGAQHILPCDVEDARSIDATAMSGASGTVKYGCASTRIDALICE